MMSIIECFMSKDLTGSFSQGLFSLQLQLKGLFEGAGGDETVALLDSMSKLSTAEQAVILRIFRKVIDRVLSGEIRVSTRRDELMKELEETLYNDIIHSMKDAANSNATSPSPIARKLEVMNGGRTPRKTKEPIDLNKARESRKVPVKPVLN